MMDTLDRAAKAAGLNRTAFSRQVLAKAAGYDLSKDPAPSRDKKYASAEERYKANLLRQQEQRKAVRAIKEAIAKGQKSAGVEAFEKYLAKYSS